MSDLFAPKGGYAVNILDLSGANGSEPVETIPGFATLEHANAFARRYVRDSIERCRAPRSTPEATLATWHTYGEDAEITPTADAAWRSATELATFAASPPASAEDRNWRILDPRADTDDDEEEEEEEDEEEEDPTP